MELEANEETRVAKLLAINNLSSHAARTEIMGVGLFFDLAAPRPLRPRGAPGP
jgi:hypothetical protein